jgi:signal transduction histidine kinase
MLIREGLRSSMITPLYSEKKPLGFLFFNSTYPNAYGERELKILNELKDTLSFAIEKAYYIEELQKALDSYKELLNFVSHEIKNPISSLITQGRLLEQGFLGEMAPPQKEIVAKMVSKAEYLLGLVRNYLDLSRIEQGRLQINIKENVNFVEEVVKEAVSIALPQIEQKKMVFEQKIEGEQYSLSIDPNLIKIVVINLLGNGAQYGKEGGKIELNVDFKNDGVYVSVKNEGEGFTEEAKSKLFRKFSRLETSKALGIKGTGLGLYITWWIVTQHKGWIDAVSELDKYAKFTFFLPRNM